MAGRKKSKCKAIYDALLTAYGPQKCFLDHETPFQLLCAVILSAQCTDKKVNTVTPELFRRYPDAAALSEIGYTGDFTYEAEGFIKRTPPELYASAARFMADTGKHIIRKIR